MAYVSSLLPLLFQDVLWRHCVYSPYPSLLVPGGALYSSPATAEKERTAFTIGRTLHRRRVMKKSARLFLSPALPLLFGGFLLAGSLLGGCYYPYEDELAPSLAPVATSYSAYYSYVWPGYYSYYGPYYYNSFWWSRPSYSYYYYTPPRRWRDWRPAPNYYRPGPGPGFGSDGPRLQSGGWNWQHRPGPNRPDFRPGSGSWPGGPAFRPNNPGFRNQPGNPGFRSPGGGQPRGGGRR